MLQFKIKELILSKGYPKPAKWLITQCGLGRNKAYHIIKGKQKTIDLEDFTRICKVVDCSPNELLYWKQTPRHTIPEGHSCLTKLTAPDGFEDWNKIFNEISPDDIAEVKKFALGKIKKQ